MNRSEIIATVRANCQKTEEAIAALPAEAWVIVWGQQVLKVGTDGRIAILGVKFYTAPRAEVEANAAKFAAKVAREIPDSIGGAIKACTAAEALETVRKAHAEMLAAIPEF